MKLKLIAATILLSGLAINPTKAETVYLNRVVATGTKLSVGNYSALNENCTSAGDITLRVTVQPKNGAISIYKGQGYTNFPTNNPRHVCNVHKTPALIAEYKPTNGYIGSDYFEILSIDSSGGEHEAKFTITVK